MSVRVCRYVVILIVCLLSADVASAQTSRRKSADSEQLGKAMEYFNTGKYHEALLILEDLDKRYTLNSRFRAYMGLCYYYEWEYDKACACLDSVMADMDVYAPHERNVYYHTAAESHFNLGHYEQAIPLYERQLTVCYDNEKGDVFYRIGFCYLFMRDRPNARDAFSSALAYYERYPSAHATEARMAQLRKMIKGIADKRELRTEN